jgi:hypothetical protein
MRARGVRWSVAMVGLALAGAGAWFAVVEPLLERREREARQAAEGGEALRRAAEQKAHELAEAEAQARQLAEARARAEDEARRYEEGKRRTPGGSPPGDYPAANPEQLPGLKPPVPRWEFDPTLHPRGVEGTQGR